MHRILLLDSGVGGLSILEEVAKRLPQVHIHYIADQKFFPYGEKTEDWLKERVLFLVESHLQAYDVELVVIACNTASTATLDTLRAHINIPVVGVVPAIKTAAWHSKNKRIGVLATPGTVSREYLTNLIKTYAHECQVKSVGSTELVRMAELSLQGTLPNPEQLKKIIQPFIDEECDQVVLGCTHFPLVKQALISIAPDIDWVDSGEAIARRVHSLLGDTLSATEQNSKIAPERVFFSSAYPLPALSQDWTSKLNLKSEHLPV